MARVGMASTRFAQMVEGFPMRRIVFSFALLLGAAFGVAGFPRALAQQPPTASAAAAGQDIVFRANFTAAAAPTFGFSHVRDRYLGTAYTQDSVPGAGPGGGDAVEITYRGVPSPTEHYVGWFTDLDGDFEQGQAVYIRLKMRLKGPVRLRSVTNPDGWSNKMVILGDEGPSSERVMWNLRDDGSSKTPIFVIEKNIDGDPARLDTRSLPQNQWINAQLRVQSSKTASSGDGRFSLYLGKDNADEKRPTHESGKFSISTEGWGKINGLGYYCDYMGSGGAISWQFAAYEVARTFDPTWGQ